MTNAMCVCIVVLVNTEMTLNGSNFPIFAFPFHVSKHIVKLRI